MIRVPPFLSKRFRALAHFSLFRAGSLGKKVFFSGWKVSGKSSATALAVEFLSKTERWKAFYIIPNYRQKCGWLACNEASAEWKATVCVGNLRIILIM